MQPGATAPAGGAREILEITTATMDFLVPQNENQAAHRRDVLAAAATDPAARARVDSGWPSRSGTSTRR